MENKRKHLEFIQDTIKRMAGNSFLLRGWSITLVIATATLANHSNNLKYLLISLFVVVVFWLLDAYYLSQERKFRCLYDETIKKDETEIDFSMKTIKNHCNDCELLSSVRSPVFLIFYGLTGLAILLILFVTYLDVTIVFK